MKRKVMIGETPGGRPIYEEFDFCESNAPAGRWVVMTCDRLTGHEGKCGTELSNGKRLVWNGRAGVGDRSNAGVS